MTWRTELIIALDRLGSRLDRMDNSPLTFKHLDELIYQLRNTQTKAPEYKTISVLSKATDQEFLNWVADRLVHVYGENPSMDFVRRLRKIAKTLETSFSAFNSP